MPAKQPVKRSDSMEASSPSTSQRMLILIVYIAVFSNLPRLKNDMVLIFISYVDSYLLTKWKIVLTHSFSRSATSPVKGVPRTDSGNSAVSSNPFAPRKLPYHTIPYHTVPYYTIPYHTLQYTLIHMLTISFTLQKPCNLMSKARRY